MDNTAEPKKYSSVSLVYSGILSAAKVQKLAPITDIIPEYNLDEAEHRALSDGKIILSFNDSPEKVRYNLPHQWDKAAVTGRKFVTSYIVFHQKSTALSELSQFEKALDNLVKANRDALNDVYVIVPRDQFSNNYIRRRINDLPDKLANLVVRFTLLPYYYFNSNRLQHVSVGKVRIVPPEEIEQILEGMSAKKSNLPIQHRTDVVPIWLGAEEGDVIEHVIPCEIGYDYVYLTVKG